MQLFNGKSRKIALVALGFFLVGWIVYLLGAIWALATWTGRLHNGRYISKSDPELIPFYTVLVGGPFVLLLGLIHAALPGLSSAIIGAISVVPSSFFVVCTSIISAESVWNIALTKYYHDHDPSMVDTLTPAPNHYQLRPAVVILLIGTLLLGLSWLTVMICSLFYNYQSEYWTQVPRQEARIQTCIAFGPGKARVEAVPAIIVSAICWIVIVVQLPVRKWFLFDGIILVGPLLYLVMFLHAGCVGGASTVSGILATILSVMYMAFVGTSLFSVDYACSVYSCRNIDSIRYVGIAELISVCSILALWPFYQHYPSSWTSQSAGETPHTAHQLERPRRASSMPGYGTSQSRKENSETQSLVK